MNARFKAYPSTKDSGSAHLGKIPQHWSATPLKGRCWIANGATPKSEVAAYWGGSIQWVTPADLSCLNSPYVAAGERTLTKDGYDSCGAQLVPPGTVILSSRAPIGAVAIAKCNLSTNQGCRSLVVGENLDSKYLYYILSVSSDQLNALGRGTTFLELSAGELGRFQIACPDLDEQVQVAKFLDNETAKIDALIEKQEQLIALLEEKRQAVISHAVTKGLNPDAPMRESGVPWAPLVPSHWPLAPNRSMLRIRKKLVGRRHSSYRLLSLTKQGVLIRDVSTGEGKYSDHLDRCQQVRPGDLVFCLFDVEETPRTVGLSAHAGMISGDYTVFECADPLTGRFLEYFYKAMDDRKLLSFLYRGLRKRIPKPGFLGAKTPMPPSEEREAIVRYLDQVVEQLARLGDSASCQVELLQERRTALISAAVTGKIDVREWKAPETEADEVVV